MQVSVCKIRAVLLQVAVDLLVMHQLAYAAQGRLVTAVRRWTRGYWLIQCRAVFCPDDTAGREAYEGW